MNKEHFYLQVKCFEGFRSKPYLCPAGKLTIGYGHTMSKGEFVQISRQYASDLLVADMVQCINQLGTLNIPLQEHEVYAIADLIFNIGFTKFKKSSLPSLLRLYSNALDKRNFTYASAMSNVICKNLLDFCHYHDKDGKVHESVGLKLRCQFRVKVWQDKPLY